jgi:two-component system, cell cycle sensor histidine kinase and response regulator CckA
MNAQTMERVALPNPAIPIRTLLVASCQEDAQLLLSQLSSAGFSCDPTVVETCDGFRAALAQHDYDIILADYRLPGWNGLDALLELRAAHKDIPFLLVTGTLGEEAAVDCIKQGANDYILKDHLSRLPLAVKRALAEKATQDENHHAQAALLRSEARNRDLVEAALYGICRISEDGRFLDCNPALLRMVGCASSSDLQQLNLGRDLFRFPEQYAHLLAACRERGHVHGRELEWRRCDGAIVTVVLHARLCSASGSPRELEIIAEDVTEVRSLERQLRESQKFEAIGQLAGGIAHDFNNVIAAILGWAELGFDQSRDQPALAERFGRIREQAEQAAALTRKLLAFARRQVLQPRAVDLNSITATTVSFLDRIIGKQIEFKFIAGVLESVKADPTQIEQVLMNLCINARDSMPDGGRLVIETEMVDLDDSYCRFYPSVVPGRYAVISVSDTGVGMDSITRERIFEPFFTTKEPGKFTGMGLATVYGIVKQHGGFLHLYSEPQHGSLFRVYLPAQVGEGAPAPSVVLSAAGTRGTETILLADDHESVREMSRQTLASQGYRVLSACDGEEALRLCERETPALAVLDVVMPKLGGPAVAARLAGRFPGLPVLLTSGYSASAGAEPDALDPRHYLQKPYSPTALARRVREMLNQHRKEQGCEYPRREPTEESSHPADERP